MAAKDLYTSYVLCLPLGSFFKPLQALSRRCQLIGWWLVGVGSAEMNGNLREGAPMHLGVFLVSFSCPYYVLSCPITLNSGDDFLHLTIYVYAGL